MSYNVENLFDLVHDGNEYREYIPDSANWGPQTHSAKLTNVASVIAAADPDIAVLCEVENKNALRNLRRTLKKQHRSYPHSTMGNPPTRSATHVAVLSRFPIQKAVCYPIPRHDGHTTRDMLEVDIGLGENTIKIFGVHWPSKHWPESWRVAAAQVLAQRINELPEGTDYVVAGDFNSNYQEAKTLSGTVHDDTHGRTGINHVLKTALSSPGQTLQMVSGSSLFTEPGLHYNLWLELQAYRRLCYVYKNTPQTPDHILVPASLYDSTGVSYVDSSFQVFRWAGRIIYNGKPFRWQMKYTRNGKVHDGLGYSDHLPLLARFRIEG